MTNSELDQEHSRTCAESGNAGVYQATMSYVKIMRAHGQTPKLVRMPDNHDILAKLATLGLSEPDEQSDDSMLDIPDELREILDSIEAA